MIILTRLKDCADHWCAANDRSLARLATLAVNDGKFFDQFDGPKQNLTTNRLAAFARFFSDPGNWPEGNVPDVAQDFFADVIGIRPQAHSASPDSEPTNIGGGMAA